MGGTAPPPVLPKAGPVGETEKNYISFQLTEILKSGRKVNTKEVFDWIAVSYFTLFPCGIL
jgi:hypothetical protein